MKAVSIGVITVQYYNMISGIGPAVTKAFGVRCSYIIVKFETWTITSPVQYNTNNKLAADTACQWPSRVRCSVLVSYPTVDG
jgi:hypothetical protein